MMSLVAEGFDSCPMEGFDEKELKKNTQTKLGMSCGYDIGIEANKNGIYGERFRINDDLVIKNLKISIFLFITFYL